MDWGRLEISYESKINRTGSYGNLFIWRYKSEPLSDRTTTNLEEETVLYIACMGWSGVGMII